MAWRTEGMSKEKLIWEGIETENTHRGGKCLHRGKSMG